MRKVRPARPTVAAVPFDPSLPASADVLPVPASEADQFVRAGVYPSPPRQVQRYGHSPAALTPPNGAGWRGGPLTPPSPHPPKRRRRRGKAAERPLPVPGETDPLPGQPDAFAGASERATWPRDLAAGCTPCENPSGRRRRLARLSARKPVVTTTGVLESRWRPLRASLRADRLSARRADAHSAFAGHRGPFSAWAGFGSVVRHSLPAEPPKPTALRPLVEAAGVPDSASCRRRVFWPGSRRRGVAVPGEGSRVMAHLHQSVHSRT